MRALLRYTDVIIASLVVGIILIIIIPLQAGLLDFLLIINISISVIIFLTTLFTTNVLQLSVFPTLLLITTLLRLALNVASTRLILSAGAAGAVIAAFGDFVIGGNYVVGMVIFIIITVIQFVVITNGSGRVAEVAARFTLDAMPGKQMAVDADLNSGLINEEQARERRKGLQREADFYGAMDGASKFVKGDAIAGIVITLINILGGLIVGMVQLGWPWQRAVTTYVSLTVGDGLVSQLSALLISTATGILITRANTDYGFGTEFSTQLFARSKVIGLTSVLLAGLGLVPAMPTIPFLAVAGATGYLAYVLHAEEREKAIRPAPAVLARPTEPENVLTLLSHEQLDMEIGFGLVRLTDGSHGGDLLERLAAVRRRLITERGVFIRPIRIRDNLQLKPNQYAVKIRGNQVAVGELQPNSLLAMDYAGGKIDVPGIDTKEPTFGLPARWISAQEREKAEILGLTVVDCTTVLVTHLSEVIKRHAHELLGRQEVRELLDKVKELNPAVVEELSTEQVALGDVQKVLQGLLQEGVGIRDMVGILEAIADNVRTSREPDFLLESVRHALARAISHAVADKGVIHVLTLHPRFEQHMLESVTTAGGGHVILEPSKLHLFFERLAKHLERVSITDGHQPVLLVPSKLRLPLRRLTQRHFPTLTILSPSEISADVEVESLGAVGLE
ncbi:MAG: Flagellar biosynthesis protein FlhA [Firmicutes bacterium]|nr:Flagellar biosynthesis protein FlhA [candidate division NPL-UPA2 bacterium]